jgi:hypothetical protein
MNHDSIMVDSRFDLIEREILWKDDRPGECTIITLFYKHTLRIEINRRMTALSGYRENVT